MARMVAPGARVGKGFFFSFKKGARCWTLVGHEFCRFLGLRLMLDGVFILFDHDDGRS